MRAQADPLLLAAVVKAGVAAGGFDLIVDDGGHLPLMQRASLEGLWPALRPGGLYVVSGQPAGAHSTVFEPLPPARSSGHPAIDPLHNAD